MDLTFDHAVIALGLVGIAGVIAIVGAIWWTIRSARVHDQLFLPFTAEDFKKLDDAVLRRAYKLDE